MPSILTTPLELSKFPPRESSPVEVSGPICPNCGSIDTTKSGELEPASIESVEPVEDGVVAGSFVVLAADLSNRGLIDAGEDNGRLDVARIEAGPRSLAGEALRSQLPLHL